MLKGEKNNLQAHTRKKNFILNQGVEKKFRDQTKTPTPPPLPSTLNIRCTERKIKKRKQLKIGGNRV